MPSGIVRYKCRQQMIATVTVGTSRCVDLLTRGRVIITSICNITQRIITGIKGLAVKIACAIGSACIDFLGAFEGIAALRDRTAYLCVWQGVTMIFYRYRSTAVVAGI